MQPNQLLASRPEPRATALVLATPKWLRAAFRASLLLCGPLFCYLALGYAGSVPVPVAVLTAGVGCATFILGAWSRPWRRFDLFIADEDGICFPANDLLAVGIGRSEDTRWLRVPWSNIADVRVARARGEGSRAVAFDVTATPEQQAAFFGRVDAPADRGNHDGALFFAAFDINPPRPEQTVARLLALARRRA